MGRRAGFAAAAVAAATLCAGVLLTACGSGTGAGVAVAKNPSPSARAGHTASASPAAATRTLPGVGPRLSAQVPASARQAVVVHGAGPASAVSTVTLFTRTGGLWHRGPSWPAHNGGNGWTAQHHEGDRKSPVGVFTLHDAGGLRADPGAKLPYHRSGAFTPPATWPAGYRHDFDYVIAIDYNRVIGTSPADPTRPLGESRGGGIWLHMDHGSGTSACVTMSEDAMRYLLRTLDPAAHPVVVMGDRARLAG